MENSRCFFTTRVRKKEIYFIGLGPLHFRTPLGPVFKLRNGKSRSGRECNSHAWSVFHTHVAVTSIFPVSKQTNLKIFWPTTDPLQAFVYKKTRQQLPGHFSHTAGYAVALKLQCITSVIIKQEFI